MRLLVTFLLSLALSLPAIAVEVTDKSVQKWLQSYSAVTAWAKTKDEKELKFLEEKQNKREPDLTNLFSTAMKDMKGHKYYGELSGVLKNNGFSDPSEWAQLGDRIMAATMAVEMDKHEAASGQSRTQMKQAMEAMMNNPNVTPEQKAQMQQMMGLGNQMVDMADKVPAQDKEVIKRNAAQIKQVMEQNARQNSQQN